MEAKRKKPTHPLTAYREFYRSNKFTDCEIWCQSEESVPTWQVIKVHKLVLAAASKKLRTLLEATDCEDPVYSSISIVGLTHSEVKRAIDLLYDALRGKKSSSDQIRESKTVLEFLGIFLEKPEPVSKLRLATPEEIAQIKAALKSKGQKDSRANVQRIGRKRPALPLNQSGETFLVIKMQKILDGIVLY